MGAGFVPLVVRETSAAAHLVPLNDSQRREAVLGPFWPSVQVVAQRFAPRQVIPVVMRQYRDIDRAAFLTFYLYPRITKDFWNLGDYRLHAIDVHAPVAYLDLTHGDAARVMNYLEIRAEQIREAPAPMLAPQAPAAWQFVIPLVTALEGAPPDAWTTEAVFLADEDGEITLTLEPSGRHATYGLRARTPLIMRDLFYDVFRDLGTGWMSVSATTPVRAGVWLVNRGRGQRAVIRTYEQLPRIPQEVRAGNRLWLLNTTEHVAQVAYDHTSIAVAPHDLSNVGVAQTAIVRTDGVLAFSTRKLADGNTEFSWP
jgi:hypothetical protein